MHKFTILHKFSDALWRLLDYIVGYLVRPQTNVNHSVNYNFQFNVIIIDCNKPIQIMIYLTFQSLMLNNSHDHFVMENIAFLINV